MFILLEKTLDLFRIKTRQFWRTLQGQNVSTHHWAEGVAPTLCHCLAMSSEVEITPGMRIQMHVPPDTHNRDLNLGHLHLWCLPCTFSVYRKMKQSLSGLHKNEFLFQVEHHSSFSVINKQRAQSLWQRRHRWKFTVEYSCCFFVRANLLYFLCMCWEHTFCRTFY